MQVTKRQHYVWRYYLKQWTDNIGNISCCRNGNVFSSDLTKIGVEKLFYQLIDISDYEASLVEALSIFSNLTNELKQMDKSWLDMNCTPCQGHIRRRDLKIRRKFSNISWNSFL